MQNSPFINRICQYCEKYVHLNEKDFIATIGSNGKLNFFFICPKCEEVDVVDERFLPDSLKLKLIANAKQAERDNKIYIYAAIIVVADLLFLALIRAITPYILNFFANIS